MIPLIQEIIERYGGRVAGSRAEKAAQHFIHEQLAIFCRTAKLHPFTAALDGHFGSLRFFVLVFLLNMLLYWWYLPLATFLSSITALFFLGHFVSYRDWLNFLYPQKKSLNVIGDIEPTDEVKSTIIVSGHIDSVHEFKWFYRLKNLGMQLTALACFLFLIQALFFLITYLFADSSTTGFNWTNITWFLLLLFSPSMICLVDMHNRNIEVDGAIDNLTGVAVAVETGKYFANPIRKGYSTLKHTRLRIISFGSEEPGLYGSKAYVRDYYDELKKENAILLNVDSLRNKQELRVVQAELNTLAFYPKDLVNKMVDAFTTCNIKVKKEYMQIGATDAAPFAFRGLPSLSIIALNTKQLDPTYHTRLDNVDNLDPAGMEAVHQAFVHFIEQWDDGF